MYFLSLSKNSKKVNLLLSLTLPHVPMFATIVNSG
jgi:hypothetical protein